MPKPAYHVSADGVARNCRAIPKGVPCPIMGKSEVKQHFETIEEAQAAYEQVMNEKNGIVIKSLNSLKFKELGLDLSISRLEDVYMHMSLPNNKPTIREIEELDVRAYALARTFYKNIETYEFRNQVLSLQEKILSDEIDALKNDSTKNIRRQTLVQERENTRTAKEDNDLSMEEVKIRYM